jgi:hypothetical protein
MSQDAVRRNIGESIVYCFSYIETKQACLRDFGMELEYWVFDKSEPKMEDNKVWKYALHILEILGYQAYTPLNRHDPSCPWHSRYVKECCATYPYQYIKRLLCGIAKEACTPPLIWLMKCKGCSTSTNYQKRTSPLLINLQQKLLPNSKNTKLNTPSFCRNAIPLGTGCLPVHATK